MHYTQQNSVTLCEAVSRPLKRVKPYLDTHNVHECQYVTCSVCSGMVVREQRLFQAFTKNLGAPAWLNLTDDLLGYHEPPGEKHRSDGAAMRPVKHSLGDGLQDSRNPGSSARQERRSETTGSLIGVASNQQMSMPAQP